MAPPSTWSYEPQKTQSPLFKGEKQMSPSLSCNWDWSWTRAAGVRGAHTATVHPSTWWRLAQYIHGERCARWLVNVSQTPPTEDSLVFCMTSHAYRVRDFSRNTSSLITCSPSVQGHNHNTPHRYTGPAIYADRGLAYHLCLDHQWESALVTATCSSRRMYHNKLSQTTRYHEVISGKPDLDMVMGLQSLHRTGAKEF